MGLLLGHGAWQIDLPSDGSMWNSCSFQPIGPWIGYSFTDLGAEGCCRSLNALFINVSFCRQFSEVVQSMSSQVLWGWSVVWRENCRCPWWSQVQGYVWRLRQHRNCWPGRHITIRWENLMITDIDIDIITTKFFKLFLLSYEASFGLRVLLLPASVCLCVRPSVCVWGNHVLVRAITHHLFKLGP